MKSKLVKKTAWILLIVIATTFLSVTTLSTFTTGTVYAETCVSLEKPDINKEPYSSNPATYEAANKAFIDGMASCAKISTQQYFEGGGESGVKVEKMFDPNNVCLKDTELSISTVIEEPMDVVGNKDGNGNGVEVRDCVRNTACVKRPDKNNNTDCISTLNKSGICETQTDQVKVTCTPVQVFLSDSGTDMLFFYISAIYKWAASIIGIIAVLVIVVSGIQISAAGGDQQVVTSAKTRITQSIIGIIVLFLSAIILYSINPTFFTK